MKYSGPPMMYAVGTFYHKIFIVHDDKREKYERRKINEKYIRIFTTKCSEGF